MEKYYMVILTNPYLSVGIICKCKKSKLIPVFPKENISESFEKMKNYLIEILNDQDSEFINMNLSNLSIIAPNKIQKIESLKGDAYSKRILVFKESKHTAQLIWKGIVNDIISICCQMDHDGRNNNDKGIIIPLNTNGKETCEIENCQDHNILEKNDNNIVKEACICCIREEMPNDFKEKDLIIKNNIKCIIKWKGFVNGEECIGVDINQNCRVNGYNFDGIIKKTNLFKFISLKGAIFANKDTVNTINMNKKHQTNIRPITSLEELSLYTIIKKENERFLLRVKSIINVDGTECLECILPKNRQFKADDIFTGNFNCNDEKEVVIIKDFHNDCFANPAKHLNINLSKFSTIEEKSICCIESLSNIREDVLLSIDTDIKVGKCVWTGKINGKNANCIQMNIEGHLGNNGVLYGEKFFDCNKNSGYFVLSSNVKNFLKINYVKNIYVSNNFNVMDTDKCSSELILNDLVYVEDEPSLYGRVQFSLKINEEIHTAIELTCNIDLGKFLSYINDILFSKSSVGLEKIIIVRLKCLKIIKDCLKLLAGSEILIDKNSIKTIELQKFGFNKKSKGDIVKFKDGAEIGFGKIKEIQLLNDVFCVLVVNSIKVIEEEEVKYIKEDNVMKVDDSLKYLEDTIVNPYSINSFERNECNLYSKGDNVLFMLRNTLKKFEGIFISSAFVNEVPCAIIELTSFYDNKEYIINTMKPFNILSDLKKHSVIVAINTLQKTSRSSEGAELSLQVSKVINAYSIREAIKNDTDSFNGMMIGDCVSVYLNDDQNVRQEFIGELKWIGKINKQNCVGIDLEEENPYGMNGKINKKYRFTCKPCHGVITTVDYVKPSKNGLKVQFNEDGVINPNKYLKCKEEWYGELFRNINVYKNGMISFITNNGARKLMKKKGILRWSGTMNDIPVAVVELDHNHEHGTAGIFWRSELIKCNNNRAVAVLIDDIHEYFPFQSILIPESERKFKEIDLNSSVIYYLCVDYELINLYGTVRWTGVDENYEYYYGIELDNIFKNGTDGTFNGQKLFECRNGYGFLAPMTHVTPDARFIFKSIKDEDIYKSAVCEAVQYSIPVKIARGKNYGIQGNTNSCYFDSSIFSLFSKSDVLDYMISPVINIKESNEITKKFREVLSWKIVYPLRKSGFVSFHQTKEMRDIIKDYGGQFFEMSKHETDMENVGALLRKLCPDNQLIKIRTSDGLINHAMFLQLFFILDIPEKYITSQQMLNMSMVQNDIVFNEPPTCLIMQAPRDANGINCYEYVLPSKTIEISNLCFSFSKMCVNCSSTAIYQCKKCIETYLRIEKGLFCRSHKCSHKEILEFRNEIIKSSYKVMMELKAIISIEKAHFVSFVKEDEFKNEWVFFDSMSTQNAENNYSISEVFFQKDISDFLNLDEEQMEIRLKSFPIHSLKKIIKDSYLFVYHNTTLTCY